MLVKILVTGLVVVLSYGGVDLVDKAWEKEEQNDIKVMQEFLGEEETEIRSEEPRLENVYATKEVTKMDDNGRIISCREYNDGSTFIMDSQQDIYTFIPKGDTSRKVVKDSQEDLEKVANKYIEFYGLRGDYSEYNKAIDEYLKDKGHDNTTEVDDCQGCKELYPSK